MSGLRSVARVAFGIALVVAALLAMGWLFLFAPNVIGAAANIGVLYGIGAIVVVVVAGFWVLRRRSN